MNLKPVPFDTDEDPFKTAMRLAFAIMASQPCVDAGLLVQELTGIADGGNVRPAVARWLHLLASDAAMSAPRG